MVEVAAMDEKQEQTERGLIRELLEQLPKRREEEENRSGSSALNVRLSLSLSLFKPIDE